MTTINIVTSPENDSDENAMPDRSYYLAVLGGGAIALGAVVAVRVAIRKYRDKKDAEKQNIFEK